MKSRKLPGGELEQSGIPAATIQWLEHHLSSAATDCASILAQKPPRTSDLPTFSTRPNFAAHCLNKTVTQREWLPQIKCYPKSEGNRVGGGISKMAKQELLATIRDHYRASSKRDKSRIPNEFIAVTGHHRKHGIRLLGQSGDDGEQLPAVKGRRIYDEAVREAVILVWEAADRICGKRLKAALPHLVESMERHGHLDLDPRVCRRLLAASAATPDRLLQPIRTPAARQLRRQRQQSLGRNIPVRTFADWNAPTPGHLEIDLVVHHSDSL